jgi:hypothetical protein
MAIPRATDVNFVGIDATGGDTLGLSATSKIGFYGTTPIVQATVAATTTTTALTGALQTDIDAIRTALINLGLIA